MKNFFYAILFLSTFVIACKNFKSKEVDRDTTINSITAFNNLFLDSINVENFLATHENFKPYEQQYLNFYKQRNYQYAWFDTSGVTEQSRNFLNLLNNTINTLQDSSLYNAALIESYNKIINAGKKNILKKEIEQTELNLTGQFFAYAAKVYKGSDINTEELGWFIPRKKVDLTALLDSTLKNNAKETYASLNNQYNQLQQYLIKYFEIDKFITDTISKVLKPFKKGTTSDSLIAIKNRLFLFGDLEQKDSTNIFDSALLVAVKKFQKRMGLAVDGSIGNKMIDEINIPIKQRIKQILINMERMRWLPIETDSNYIVVNIPEYKMHVYDSGKLQFNMNVIVGKASNSTVIFTGNLKYIVFSPYWNVPPSIVQKETLPGIKKDPNYLAKNNMEITGKSNGLPIVRQKPGPNNSLGLVKFLFPNSYDIYFHDTPNHDLFSATSRDFSHGCIRLSEPKKFAQYLLRKDTATIWKNKVIDSCMHLPTEKWVTLNKTVPVSIVYFTAWVDGNGLLNFRKDIYGHDAKMSEKLFTKKK
ncbi:MAG: L,D-transpeptidase family protein [Bacteroidetes bacterium]|nr:L,D-transpeptidase family protein [Bacteroidota bacterium]